MKERTFPSFGALLRFLRNRSGKTQKEVAETLRIAQSTLSGWERLAEPPNDPFLLGQLSDLFGVPAEDIAVRRLRIPDEVAPYLASPYEKAFKIIQRRIPPEDISAFTELVREWSEWSDEYRGTVILLGRMKIKDRPKKGNLTRIWTDVPDEEREER